MCAVRMSALFHTFVARLKSHLCRRTNSEPHKCVYHSQIYVLMERFTWAELADIHLAYGSACGKGREAQRICHKRFPNSVCPDYRTFASVDRRIRETVTYAVNRHSTGRGRSFRTPHLMRTFCSVLRRIPPQATARLVTHSVWIVVLCGTLYASRISIRSIGRRCKLH